MALSSFLLKGSCAILWKCKIAILVRGRVVIPFMLATFGICLNVNVSGGSSLKETSYAISARVLK